MLAEEDVRALGATYTVNDIDPDELARAPEWVSRLEGDIADPSLLGGEDGFDVVFANMVFEHVSDPQEGYRNIVARLSPGGYLVNFVPTMYAPPFVLNKLLPEDLTSRLLLRIQPHRHVGDKPKFPAYYRWCTATSATEARLRGCRLLRMRGSALLRALLLQEGSGPSRRQRPGEPRRPQARLASARQLRLPRRPTLTAAR